MTTLPLKLREVLDGLTGGRLAFWYVMKEKFVWGEQLEDEKIKRRSVLQGWLRALGRSTTAREWSTIKEKCTISNPDLASEIGSDPAAVLVLESMLYALRPLEVEDLALQKKKLRDIRDAANKLTKALAVMQRSGVSLSVLAPGVALEPLVKDAAFITLEGVKSLRGRDQVDANTQRQWKQDIAQQIAGQVRPQPEMLPVWLDELSRNCGDWLEAPGWAMRGKEPARRARALAVCLARNFRLSLGGKPDWAAAAAFASAATGESIDQESLRTTSAKRNKRRQSRSQLRKN